MRNQRYEETLKAICDLPTAPYHERHVIAWLVAWANQHQPIRVRRDKAGNVYLEYLQAAKGAKLTRPVVIEAHMDHPGFVAMKPSRNGNVEAEFRGMVKPSHFAGARARFWLEDTPPGRWIKARVKNVKQIKGRRELTVRLMLEKEMGRMPKLETGTLGMWDLPDAQIKRDLFAARVCDDLAGVAAIVCMLEELIAGKIPGHVIGLCTRAEEVGFAGVLAVCEHGWIPKRAAVIGLETSKASAPSGGAPQGAGPVIRVGDRTGIFSAGLTHFLSQAAGHIGDADSSFHYQRKLMDGGTCNATAFMAWGYDSAGICVALGNYHNMTIKGETGWRAGIGGKAGPGIASETIHLGDFAGMVRILVEAVKRIGAYQPGFGTVKQRLAKLHREEQKKLLYARGAETRT